MCKCLDKSFRTAGIALTSVFGVLGVAVAGFAAFMLWGQTGVDISELELFGATSLKFMLGGGALMLLLAILTCAGLCTRKKRFVVPSMLVLLIVMVVHGVAAVGVVRKRALFRIAREAADASTTVESLQEISLHHGEQLADGFQEGLFHDLNVLSSSCVPAEGSTVAFSGSLESVNWSVASEYDCPAVPLMADVIGDVTAADVTNGSITSCMARTKEDYEMEVNNRLALSCATEGRFAGFMEHLQQRQAVLVLASLAMEVIVLIAMFCAVCRKGEEKKPRESVVAGSP